MTWVLTVPNARSTKETRPAVPHHRRPVQGTEQQGPAGWAGRRAGEALGPALLPLPPAPHSPGARCSQTCRHSRLLQFTGIMSLLWSPNKGAPYAAGVTSRLKGEGTKQAEDGIFLHQREATWKTSAHIRAPEAAAQPRARLPPTGSGRGGRAQPRRSPGLRNREHWPVPAGETGAGGDLLDREP